MSSFISLLLSIIYAVFPFISSFLPKQSILEDMSYVTMEEMGNDVVYFSEDSAGEETLFYTTADEPESALPPKYDARDYSLITTPKSQGNTGCCWAFGALSAAETSMIKNGLADLSVDYSEAHLAWFGLRSIAENPRDSANGDGICSPDPYADGGNWARSVFALARWTGPQLEEAAPFEFIPSMMGNYSENDRYVSYAHLQNSKYIPADNQNAIKQAILDNGSIAFSYNHNKTFVNSTESGGTSYYQRSVTSSNHTAVIVGWDDSYSKANFKYTPETDGAWLVKNSWGDYWGDYGYMWLSYCDTSLSYFVTYEMESPDNYENINQYDGFGYKGWGFLTGHNTMSMANIFKTKNCEKIRAVSFYTVQPEVNYTVEVYSHVTENGMPTDGTLCLTQQGYFKYRGYYTVNLTDPITLPKGTRYSIVISITVPEGENALIPLEYPEGFDGAHNRSYSGKAGQSFIAVDRLFNEWEDTGAEGYNNVCIKTFSDNLDFRLKITSDMRLSEGFLGGVNSGDSEDYILSQFENKNIRFENGCVVLFSETDEIIKQIEIAYTGDIDNDGNLDYDDLSMLALIVTGLTDFDERQRLCADIDKNRIIDANDFLAFTFYFYGGTL